MDSIDRIIDKSLEDMKVRPLRVTLQKIVILLAPYYGVGDSPDGLAILERVKSVLGISNPKPVNDLSKAETDD